MSGICSLHKDYNEDCNLCNSTLANLLNVSEEVLDKKIAFAKSEGEIHCAHCNFKMYKATTKNQDGTNNCPLCDNNF